MKYLIKNIAGEVIFEGTDLSGADLRRSDLICADLRRSDLSGADLSMANLCGTDLSGAFLRRADLSGANLSGADLRGANVIYISATPATSFYDICMTPEHIKIGCQWHAINDWFDFDDDAILKMDGKKAKKFWDVWKPILMQMAKNNGWYNDAA